MTAKTITWFHDSPDAGPDCICSLCGRPILEDEVPIRAWDDEAPELELRFHYACFQEAQQNPEQYTAVIVLIDTRDTCDHIWDGPFVEASDEMGNISTATCSKCGMWAIDHDLRYGP